MSLPRLVHREICYYHTQAVYVPNVGGSMKPVAFPATGIGMCSINPRNGAQISQRAWMCIRQRGGGHHLNTRQHRLYMMRPVFLRQHIPMPNTDYAGDATQDDRCGRHWTSDQNRLVTFQCLCSRPRRQLLWIWQEGGRRGACRLRPVLRPRRHALSGMLRESPWWCVNQERSVALVMEVDGDIELRPCRIAMLQPACRACAGVMSGCREIEIEYSK